MTSAYSYAPYTTLFPSFLQPYLFYSSAAAPPPATNPPSASGPTATFTEIPVSYAAFFDPFDPLQPSSTFAAYVAAQSQAQGGPQSHQQQHPQCSSHDPREGPPIGTFSAGTAGIGVGSGAEPVYIPAEHMFGFPGVGMAEQDDHHRFRQQRHQPPPYHYPSAFHHQPTSHPLHSHPQTHRDPTGFPFAFPPAAAAPGGLSGHRHGQARAGSGGEAGAGGGAHVYPSSGGFYDGSFVRESGGGSHYHHPYDTCGKKRRKDTSGTGSYGKRGSPSSGSGSGSKKKQKVYYRPVKGFSGCVVM